MATARAAVGRLVAWRGGDRRTRFLQVVQPALIGLIDGTISTLAPIFAAAFGRRDQHGHVRGAVRRRDDLGPRRIRRPRAGDGGRHLRRGRAPRAAFLIPHLVVALAVAGGLVAAELVAIALVRARYLHVSLTRSVTQVAVGGAVVAMVGVAVGHV